MPLQQGEGYHSKKAPFIVIARSGSDEAIFSFSFEIASLRSQ